MDGKTYYGIYRGICQDNDDPDSLNRVKFTCHQVLYTNWSNWAYPVNPITGNATHINHTDVITSGSSSSGTAHTHSVTLNASHSDHIKVPDIGQGVWVMFEGGDPNFPLWVGVY